jgi:peptidoglycan/xylan/chitin deacetylase (PgdA/CDA1 family)
MKHSVRVLCFTLSISLFFPLTAEISFRSPDINSKNEVLFTVRADIPGKGSYDTLCLKNIDAGIIEQLTFYPERMESLSGGAILQIRNRFGTGRFNTATGVFSWIRDFRPFFEGGTPALGVLGDVSVSPDGRWIVSIEAVTYSRGRLVLLDSTRNTRYVLAESVERGGIPVSWAPDSSILLYSLDGNLYFSRPEAFFSQTPVDMKYRLLGPGSINNISWFSSSRFLYASGSSVYLVQSSELFARALYSPLISIGSLAGKLPCSFDSTADSFCASPDGRAILYARDHRSVYYCPMTGDDYALAEAAGFMPYLLLAGNTADVAFIWTSSAVPVVLTEAVEDGKRIIRGWKLDSVKEGAVFTRLSIPFGPVSYAVSPDGSLIAFNTTSGIRIYSLSTWKETASWNDEKVSSMVWADENVLYIGGAETIRKWNIASGQAAPLLLSSVSAAGWNEQGDSILADTESLGRFQYRGSMLWDQAASGRMRPAAGSNASWRIYLDSGSNYYSNMLYARSSRSPGGTSALISEPRISLDSVLPQTKASSRLASDIFTNGSRSGLRQVALVFDAMDSIEGLSNILSVLDRYSIRSTFFINGEFIRQHPSAVNEIVKAGHQTGSLFFTTWDLSGTGFRIDEDFIIRGLSRNEDDFYNATGQELTLLWHAPYYVVSPLVLKAGSAAGYRYVSGDVSVPDWATLEQDRLMPGLYKSSADIIEEILKTKKPGSIIPVRIGRTSGTRNDYLYDRVDLLINALVEAGYEIVTVDELIKRAR